MVSHSIYRDLPRASMAGNKFPSENLNHLLPSAIAVAALLLTLLFFNCSTIRNMKPHVQMCRPLAQILNIIITHIFHITTTDDE